MLRIVVSYKQATKKCRPGPRDWQSSISIIYTEGPITEDEIFKHLKEENMRREEYEVQFVTSGEYEA